MSSSSLQRVLQEGLWPYKIVKGFENSAKVAKFRQVWLHWPTSREMQPTQIVIWQKIDKNILFLLVPSMLNVSIKKAISIN